MGFRIPYPYPLYPMGINFSHLYTHGYFFCLIPVRLMGIYPAGTRVMGTHCHPYPDPLCSSSFYSVFLPLSHPTTTSPWRRTLEPSPYKPSSPSPSPCRQDGLCTKNRGELLRFDDMVLFFLSSHRRNPAAPVLLLLLRQRTRILGEL
jgi:hypothetical protein